MCFEFSAILQELSRYENTARCKQEIAVRSWLCLVRAQLTELPEGGELSQPRSYEARPQPPPFRGCVSSERGHLTDLVLFGCYIASKTVPKNPLALGGEPDIRE